MEYEVVTHYRAERRHVVEAENACEAREKAVAAIADENGSSPVKIGYQCAVDVETISAVKDSAVQALIAVFNHWYDGDSLAFSLGEFVFVSNEGKVLSGGRNALLKLAQIAQDLPKGFGNE